MKKLLLVTAASVLGLNTVHAAPTVYGKLHVTIDNVDKFGVSKADTDNVWEINSNASRIGIKGEEILTDRLKALYLAEWQVNTDGDGTDLEMRNRYLGLKYDRLGSVKVGRIDSHVKNTQAKIDFFNDVHVLDMKNTFAGENRLNNVISFESDPKALQGFGLNVMLQQSENNKLTGNSDEVGDSLGDAISASLIYDNKDIGIYAALAGDKNVVSHFNAAGNSGAKAEAEIIRVVGSIDLGSMANVAGLTLNGLYQNAKPTNLSKAATAPALAATATTPALAAGVFRDFDQENSFLLSAAYTIGETPWTAKAQYQQSTTSFDGAKDDVQLSQIGGMLDYMFNSKTRAYGYVAQQSDDRNNVEDRLSVGVGMEFNF